MKYLSSKYFYVLIFFLISSLSLSLLYIYKQKQLNSFLTLKTKEAKQRYYGMSVFPKDISALVFTYLINKPEVINIFKDAYKSNDKQKAIIRKKLYDKLINSYLDLVAHNIYQLHFHLPNNDSFLRFHRPNKYGDNLTNIRKTVAYANKHKVVVEGFEEGTIINGYRFVYPLFDENKNHIGSVEISHSINAFKELYQRSFTEHNLNIVISTELISKKVFMDEQRNYDLYPLNNNFMYQVSMGIADEIKELPFSKSTREFVAIKMANYEEFSAVIHYHDSYEIASFIPIFNSITKDGVAYAISFSKSSYLDNYYGEIKFYIFYLVSLVLALVLAFYFIVQYNLELKKEIYSDSLMNIHNRKFFEEYLKNIILQQKRNKTNISLIMFDIDFFKKINDNYGHEIGDKALVTLANIVKKNIRDGDVFARWGGEEFMIVLESTFIHAVVMAENLRKIIEDETKNLADVPPITCSFGVINMDEATNLNEAFKKVDDKLYKAKLTGRNKVIS